MYKYQAYVKLVDEEELAEYIQELREQLDRDITLEDIDINRVIKIE